MEPLEVRLGERSYPIYIGPSLLGNRALFTACVPARQVMIVTNEVVAPLYLAVLEKSLAGGRELRTLVLPDGEEQKTLTTFARIIDELIAASFHRDAVIVALGGGVIGDVAGFAAACYQRGIACVQVATTLLAQVDSAVGGKTAVNHPRAKNMIGAFHQPAAVFSDTDTLATLPERELSAGLAEVIKYGLALDAQFFAWLEEHVEALLAREPRALTFAIRRSCELKAAIVAEDEREQGRRALLNLGHTYAHALESLSGYGRWLHGEAVAIGMRLAARTSQALGTLDEAECRRIEAVLERARLPLHAAGTAADDLLAHMRLDKKAAQGGLRLVLLDGIGRGVVRPAPGETLLRDVADAALRA